MSNDLVLREHPIDALERMGQYIAKSGLFGMKTQEQAVALMIVAQAEGRHPGSAAQDYHIIQGRPSLKADAMLARFQKQGGTVRWLEYTDTKVVGVFSHPQGGELTVDWDMDRAKRAALGVKDNWKNYPRQMLRARVISEGIRTVFPGVLGGMYTPEEVMDFEDPPKDQPKMPPQANKKATSARSKPPEEPQPDERLRLDFVAFCDEAGLPFPRVDDYLATFKDPKLIMLRGLDNKDGFIKAFNAWLSPKIGADLRQDDIPL